MRDNKWWEKSTFKFCKFPKVFLTHPKYRALSHGAMVVYAALIDRMSLSEHNGWVDKEGSIFIRYANKELCRTLNCSHETATKKLKELEKFDLLKRKKQGQGKSDIIYVLEPEELCENVALQNAKTLHHRMQGSSVAEGKELASNKTENNNTVLIILIYLSEGTMRMRFVKSLKKILIMKYYLKDILKEENWTESLL